MKNYQIIYAQLGHKTFVMLGAYNIIGDEKKCSLSFRFKASKTVNYIIISLNSLDLYNMEFGQIRGDNYKVVATEKDVYFDQLNAMIEANTGCYTRL